MTEPAYAPCLACVVLLALLEAACYQQACLALQSCLQLDLQCPAYHVMKA